MSFFETIDEQRAIVLAQIAEVRIWKNFSLTWAHPNPLCSFSNVHRTFPVPPVLAKTKKLEQYPTNSADPLKAVPNYHPKANIV